MLTRVRRAAATAVLLVAAPLGLPLESAAATAVCDSDAQAVCVDYGLQVLAAGTESPTTQSQAPVDIRLDFANTSDNYVNDVGQARWLNRVSATLLSSASITPTITGSAALPDKLLVAGAAADCVAGADFSFSTCDAGHGVAYVKLSGLLYNGIFKATFGIHRIYNDKAQLGSHFAALSADLTICADTDGGTMSCNQTLNQSSTLHLDKPAAGQPWKLDFELPPVSVPFHTVQAMAADSASLHLRGQSDQLTTGPAPATYTFVRLPMRCGAVSGGGTAYAKGGQSVAITQAFTITGCSQLAVTKATSKVVLGGAATLAGTLTDFDTQTPMVGTTVQLRACATTATSPCSTVTSSKATTTGGAWTFSVKPTKNTRYFVRVGAVDGKPASWVTRSVTVAPRISLTTSRTSVPSGGTVRLTGSVAPNHAGKAVRIQRLTAGVWKTIASATLSTRSAYAKTITLKGARGSTARLRVVLPAHTDHATGISRTAGIRFS